MLTNQDQETATRAAAAARRSLRGRMLAPLCVAVLVATLAACSSSGTGSSANTTSANTTSSGTSAGTGGSSMSAAVAKATAFIAKASAQQPPIKLPALPSRPAAGKTIEVIGCALPICSDTSDQILAGAKKLGWKSTLIRSPFTPEGYIGAFNQAIAAKPDMIAYLGFFPNATIAAQLATAKKDGIKVVGVATSDDPSPVMSAAYAGKARNAYAGVIDANLVVADAKAPTQVLWAYDPTFKTIFGAQIDALKQTLAQLCPACKYNELDFSVAEIGRGVPGQVVSALQKNPKIKYVFFGDDGNTIGVYAALQAAGLADKVKIVGQDPTKQALDLIKTGQQYASVALETGAAGYRAIDGLARLSEGQPLGSCCTSPVGWSQVITKANVPAASTLLSDGSPPIPGFPQAFWTAWHVS